MAAVLVHAICDVIGIVYEKSMLLVPSFCDRGPEHIQEVASPTVISRLTCVTGRESPGRIVYGEPGWLRSEGVRLLQSLYHGSKAAARCYRVELAVSMPAIATGRLLLNTALRFLIGSTGQRS